MTTSAAPGRPRAAERVAATNRVAERFFGAYAASIACACEAMAERFQRGGRLLVCGDAAQRSDVAHVVVEFMHPVVVGKRALPAVALPRIADGSAATALPVIARSADMLLVMSARLVDAEAERLIGVAAVHGMLTVVFTGGIDDPAPPGDHVFVVPSGDECIVQETQEMLYHVLWELVHVFFDHRAVAA